MTNEAIEKQNHWKIVCAKGVKFVDLQIILKKQTNFLDTNDEKTIFDNSDNVVAGDGDDSQRWVALGYSGRS